MEIDSYDAVDTCARDHVGYQLRRDRRAANGAAILTGIAEVRDDGGDTANRRASQRIGQDKQFHEMTVGWGACGLENIDVITAHILMKLNVDFLVGEALDRAVYQGKI
ncbi:hypothetical protein D9M72_624960 [compost metagenome]